MQLEQASGSQDLHDVRSSLSTRLANAEMSGKCLANVCQMSGKCLVKSESVRPNATEARGL